MLPIAQYKDVILKSVANNQVTIVVGETGSGKTTKLNEYLFEAGYGRRGIIGVTEPRRIAAMSVARFVASNLNVQLGKTVAYKVRFDDTTHRDTALKFMTDGILLRELHFDPMLSQYSVIVVDEAHERSANIDFLLGLLKNLLVQRPELRVIVASATIDAQKFSTYFGGAPIITVSGRTHPVRIEWAAEDLQATTPQEFTRNVATRIQKVLSTTTVGDLLVFLTGVDEINAVWDALGNTGNSVEVLPAHGSLSADEQSRIFGTFPGKRKVVLATNIAETSLTIDGVVYVIDTGNIKQTHFDAEVGIQSLDVVPHSQAGCAQRAGRAGRTQPGVCYRLYTERNFQNRPLFTEPEIKRMSLAGVVLAMEALEIPNIRTFDFIDPPNAKTFKEAYDTLEALGAIEVNKPGLTPLGMRMSALPLEPRVSRMVIEAEKYGCVDEIVTIAAFLSVGRSAFVRPKDKEREADMAHGQFKHYRSDMLTFLKLYKEFQNADSNGDWEWARRSFVSGKTMHEIRMIRRQLVDHLSRSRVEMSRSEDATAILRCVAAGLAYNLLQAAERHSFVSVERSLSEIFTHPSSALFKRGITRWMVCAEIVETRRCYARICSMVEADWLPDIAPNRFTLGKSEVRQVAAGLIGVQPIVMKGRYGTEQVIALRQVPMTQDEAWHAQEEHIAEAQKAGMEMLVAVRDRASWVMKGRSENGLLYYLGSLNGTTITPGERYYCTLTYGGSAAYAEFQVFNLPKPATPLSTKEEPAADVMERLKARPDDGTLGSILERALAQRLAASGK